MKYFYALIICLACVSSSLVPQLASAQKPTKSTYYTATVERIEQEWTEETSGVPRTVQTVQLELRSGPNKGKIISLENGIMNGREEMRLQEGETVIIQQLEKINGSTEYLLREKYRLPWLLILTLIFIGMGILFGGRVGATSLLGLAFSIFVLVWFVVPRIVAGDNPLLISFVGSCIIAGSSLYLAHGFSKRTSIAVVSTLVTLVLSTAMAVASVHFSKLFGLGTEESFFLQLGPLQQVNLRGLLLGGIVIGALGILDDITTGQTAAIHEISKANPKMTAKELYRSGVSIGREHIAALMNTLALAYAGASLPLLLLFYTQREQPLWVILNSEFMAEEIVRTLVGSATLVLAVPIATYFAAKCFEKGRGLQVSGEGGGCGHCHGHTH